MLHQVKPRYDGYDLTAAGTALESDHRHRHLAGRYRIMCHTHERLFVCCRRRRRTSERQGRYKVVTVHTTWSYIIPFAAISHSGW